MDVRRELIFEVVADIGDGDDDDGDRRNGCAKQVDSIEALKGLVVMLMVMVMIKS